MGENSKIEWTTHTFNPWLGCSKVSPACDHCYAESWARRTGQPELWKGERRHTSAQYWKQPRKWDRDAATADARPRVFCASLADVFDNEVPLSWRAELFSLIRTTPHLDWLLLTKRVGNVSKMCADMLQPLPPNAWLGATVVNQEEVLRDVPKLLATPARVRFLSCEPLLCRIDLTKIPDGNNGYTFNALTGRYNWTRIDMDAPFPWPSKLDWVICGGESGRGARGMPSEWAEDMREQCRRAGVAFFMKQGSAANWPSFKDFESFPESIRVREFPR